ncbi:hematopoietic SH2 domain-containing protein isoform X3 [Canis aureus]
MTEARKLPPPLPPRLDWFVQTQVGQLAQGGVPAWFHGAISREDAENLLELQPLGSFLIRVSHSHVGYTLSYKAQSCCRHFMVKLLDDGSFRIPGEEKTHASLDALVTFHQQQPVRPHGDLLTQPCGQTSTRPALLHWPKGRKPAAEMDRASTQEATSPSPPKAPLAETRRKLWKNLKMLPQMGKRVQQQLTSHQTSMNSSSLWSSGPPVVTHSSGARPGDTNCEDNVNTDCFVATPIASPSEPQDLRNRGDPSRRASRLASWSEATPSTRSWHQVVVRALSSKVSKSETKDLIEPQKDWLPEEYRPPPPFAPGYC